MGEEGEGEGWLREIERIRNKDKREKEMDRNEWKEKQRSL